MWTWRDALVLLGAYLPASVIGFLLSQLLPRGWGGVAGPPLLSQFVVYALCAAVIAALARLTVDQPRKALGITLPPLALIPALLGGPLLALALGFTGALLKTPTIDTVVKDWLADPASLPYVALFIVILAPLTEELVFRGFFQPLAIGSLRPVGGIVATACAFALLHGPTYHWTWQHLIVMALAGSAFGLLRHQTGSTLAAAVLHATYNGTMLYAYLVQP